MKLIPISEHPDAARILYQLLEERPEYANISHRSMPTWDEHLAFIAKKTDWASVNAYQDWLLIEYGGEIRGAVYMTDRCEIGVAILKAHQGKGYGPWAVTTLMHKYGKRRYLANVAPTNEPSRKMFEKLGFKVIQHTLALETGENPAIWSAEKITPAEALKRWPKP